MGRVVLGILKYSLFAMIVLLASQIRYDGRRICDRVGDLLASRAVSTPLKWASRTFDVKQPDTLARKRPGRERHGMPESDRAALSGLLKAR